MSTTLPVPATPCDAGLLIISFLYFSSSAWTRVATALPGAGRLVAGTLSGH